MLLLRRSSGLGLRLLVQFERRLLGRSSEPAFNALCHSGHQDTVAEPLPAFLRVVDRDDCPAASRWASGMEYLTLREAAIAGMYCCYRRVVSLFGATCEVMHNRVCHLVLLSSVSSVALLLHRPRACWERELSRTSTLPRCELAAMTGRTQPPPAFWGLSREASLVACEMIPLGLHWGGEPHRELWCHSCGESGIGPVQRLVPWRQRGLLSSRDYKIWAGRGQGLAAAIVGHEAVACRPVGGL